MAKNISHHHSMRILFIFGAIGILLFFIILTSGHYLLQKKIHAGIYKNFAYHADYIVQQINFPHDGKASQKLALEEDVEIIVLGDKVRWKSFPELFSIEQMEVLKHTTHINNNDYQSALYKDNYITWTQKKAHDIIIMHRNINLFEYELIIASIVIIIIALLFYYIYHLFITLEFVKQGVRQISSGNLKHRIDISKSGDLKDLAVTFNNMSLRISELLESKKQLLLAISHELRAPLTRAKLALSIMPESSQQQSLRYDVDQMQNLINELLESEKLQEKHSSLNLQLLDINTLINQVVEDFYPNKNIKLDLQQLPVLPLDNSRVKFVIKNLIDNSIKYQKKQDVEIILSTKYKNGYVQLIVKDQGIGIDKEHIKLLGEPFYRIDASRQRKTGGFGLGLYLSMIIIEAHKGKIDIQSIKNHGTTITITLVS